MEPAIPLSSTRHHRCRRTVCDEELAIRLGWLVDYEKDIVEFADMINAVQLANELGRQQRINSSTWTLAKKVFDIEIKTKKGKKLAKEILAFLKNISKLAGKKNLIGSSEILESAFGKLKSLDRECGNSGFTSSILGLGACFGKLEYETISKAMETISDADVNEWKSKAICETQQSKRRKLLKVNKKESLKLKLTRILEPEKSAA